MPDRRWLRLKAKLWRRSSTSSVPAAATASTDDGSAGSSHDCNFSSSFSHHEPPPPHSHDHDHDHDHGNGSPPTPSSLPHNFPHRDSLVNSVTDNGQLQDPSANVSPSADHQTARRAHSCQTLSRPSPDDGRPPSHPVASEHGDSLASAAVGDISREPVPTSSRGQLDGPLDGPLDNTPSVKPRPEDTVEEQREENRPSAIQQTGAASSSAPRLPLQRKPVARTSSSSKRPNSSLCSEHGHPPPTTSLAPDRLPSPIPTPPPPSAGRANAPSFQLAFNSLSLERLGSAVVEPQLPVLDAVAEIPSGESTTYQVVTSTTPAPFPKRPSLGSRRQSLLAPSHQHLINSLLDSGPTGEPDGFDNGRFNTYGTGMVRKIWVKRPGGSATLVPITDDFVVDELRDQVINKYANSLGKTFDAPDIVVRISPREGSNRQTTPDRILSPEESLMNVVDTYYPGGQVIEEALIIDIPQRRTPKPSPRPQVYYNQSEPGEHGDYFPLMPANPTVPTPPSHPNNSSASVNAHPAPSISILTTGMAPPLPSPGSRGNRHPRRPPLTRHTTNSPTMLGQVTAPKDPNGVPGPLSSQPVPSIPTPPGPPPESPQAKSLTPPARGASPRPRPSASSAKPKKPSATQSLSGAFGGLIEGTVPPINVLIVEDNNINQRLLEAFMKRLSVRWKCAANGAEAVKKWRQGGFHLVLMDIQLPVMNGLDATKEIRRLERLNGIGVFPKTADGRSSAATASVTSPPAIPGNSDPLNEEDTLHDLSLFKSPVIIVALTASSLQSDRHEALAAGCNDFLTKPVRFEWLQQKVTEWGCMQALIDFEGWRKWRGYANDTYYFPTAEGHTSPMQTGPETASKKPSPSITPSPSSMLSQNGKKERKALHLPKPIDVTPEDSSGSGSGEGLDSPSSPVTSVPVPGISADADAL
ncbi:uncharacterized protein BO72DRAFT_463848 [Aspergillus fijiensis CBS 313.89]|uniref:Response regulatory domain-containing protein n=1 Tax=Aspergillus fijiensis CBS 313.89 TaxID=1448319 RepID=A0A8G1RH76_9EURO|nr:uncharacterized protein BO72DRAFT_463848 [Aspergillus fijiensis CBS 313.89]RAK71426.1 hypothetical protein BO72DRAFT_463848 [Aspergillus fijiensis CBS 313.89]